MNKNIVTLFAVALFVPAAAMAQHHGGPVTHQPGHNNGGFSQPSHGNGGYNQPGNNNGGYNQPGNNNGGYNQPGHNNGGFNPGHPGHPGNNNGGFNPGHPGHPGNNNGGFNPGHPGHPGNNNGGFNPGHPGHPGNPGHNGPSNQKELMMAHRSIERAFMDAENSYYPFMMSQEDRRNMAFAMRRITDELGSMMLYVDSRKGEEIRRIAMMVEKAKFTLISENSANEAHRILQRAEMTYKRLASTII